ncbi:MAG: hypothetical protein HC824_21375, partial [Synechococcales cyanobacterium RM1_1_8]|nr:hypothetical protein [Synechococcales cyanobacterium RM1_1_8]
MTPPPSPSQSRPAGLDPDVAPELDRSGPDSGRLSHPARAAIAPQPITSSAAPAPGKRSAKKTAPFKKPGPQPKGELAPL